ncbi:universal stress protein [Caenimonas sedimenti]|nr:universal stress protein [Caenimonas sedimenti]
MNILLAIDGSDAALHACRLAAAFAGRCKTPAVTLLNVQRPPLRLSLQGGVPYQVLEDALREEGTRQLQPAVRLLTEAGHAATQIVRLGPPADTVLDTARECAADVLVLGNGRHGPVGGYALGSVALRVAPAAHCPAIVVRPGAPVLSGAGATLRVTAPVDGSQEGLRGLERLAAWSVAVGPMLVDLVHFGPGLSLAAAVLPPHDDVLREWGGLDTDAALGAAEKVLATAGIAHTTHRLHGAPETGIAAFAREQRADFISMATRGRGAMHHLLLGSVALRTAQASEVPVAFMR